MAEALADCRVVEGTAGERRGAAGRHDMETLPGQTDAISVRCWQVVVSRGSSSLHLHA